MHISNCEIKNLLREEDNNKIQELFARADSVRKKYVGDAVHLRGLVEFSNFCARRCAYCGISANFSDVKHYRMSHAEVLESAKKIVKLGYGTIVLQSGEDWGMTTEWMTELLLLIKKETNLAVTLSVGERNITELQEWFEAGADRYLLRFETSNRELYRKIHPDIQSRVSDRFALLKELRRIGYEVGSGVMVGIPGQTYDDLVNDIRAFHELDLDMIGIGPYIASPGTELANNKELEKIVPNTVDMACKVVALARIVCPDVNIPSTTALATLSGENGRVQGLNCGANVLMPNITPPEYRCLYSIYPEKTALNEEEGEFHLSEWLASIGRTQGNGRGDSLNLLSRMSAKKWF